MAKPLKKVRVSMMNAIHDLPLLVARDEGFFRDAGLDVDILKTPGSGEAGKNLWGNLAYMTARDEIKFVVCNEADYEWAKRQLRERRLDATCPVLFSPSYRDLPATQLADWILRDQLPVRMQVQLHKQLWGEKPGV